MSSGAESRVEATTDSEGAYSFASHLEPGEYELYASGPGKATSPIVIEKTDEGRIQVLETNNEVSYVLDPSSDQDGLIALNRITFYPTGNIQITVDGEGEVDVE